ncbi:MAG: hypothetical protein ACYC92_00965, partial [Candidatus Acidiferrales bacterium]
MNATTSGENNVVRAHRLWAWLIAVGVGLAALGIFFNFELECKSRATALTDFQFFLLEYTYIPMLMVGLPASLLGSAIWAWRAPVLKLVWSGIILGICALVAAKL